MKMHGVGRMSDNIAFEASTGESGGVTARICGHTFLPSLLGQAPLVLDIGANQGDFMRAMVQKFGCRVHALEPNPYLYADLQGSAVPGVTVQNVALADTRGPRPFVLMEDTEYSHFSSAGDSSIQVEAVTLGDVVSQIPKASIDLIKMDIEGAELDILERLPLEVLERIRQITVEFHQFLYPESRLRIEGIKKRFRDAGFWVVDFSRTNYDVLFVHSSARPSLQLRASILYEKYRRPIRRRLSHWFGARGGER
jgi:FkbM family methyltransferase